MSGVTKEEQLDFESDLMGILGEGGGGTGEAAGDEGSATPGAAMKEECPEHFCVVRGCSVGVGCASSGDAAGGKCVTCDAILEVLRTAGPKASPPLCVAKGSDEWRVLMQAHEMLRLEGHTSISYIALQARYSILTTVLSRTKPASTAASSHASSSSEHGGQQARPVGILSAPTYTPVKAKAEKAESTTASAAGFGRSPGSASAPSPSCSASGARAGATPVERGRLSAPSFARQRQPTPQQPSSVKAEPEEDPADDPQIADGLHPFSLEAKLPQGQLGVSLTRIRRTINEYICRLSSGGWYDGFKLATVKALERKLGSHEDSVVKSMHVDLIAGYKQLQRRIAQLVSLYRDLSSWATSDVDGQLPKLLRTAMSLKPVLEHFGLDYAADLQIVWARAAFQSTYNETGSVAKAFDMIDVETLVGHFSTMGAERQGALNEPVTEMKEEQEFDQDGGGTGQKDKDKCGKATKMDKRPSLFPANASAKSLLATMFDKAFHMMIYRMSEKGAGVSVDTLIFDLAAVQSKFAHYFPSDVGCIGLPEVLDAVGVIAKCDLCDARAHPLPSVVRAARQTVHLAANSTVRIWKAAFALSQHDYGRKMLECSRQVAAVGLQDRAADEQFDSMCERFEQAMCTAYEQGVPTWMQSGGPGGEPFTTESFQDFLILGKKTSAETVMVMGLWSTARTEKRSEELCDLLVGLTALASVGSWVAAAAFVKEFPAAAAMLSEPGPGASAEGAAASARATEDELMADGDQTAAPATPTGPQEAPPSDAGRQGEDTAFKRGFFEFLPIMPKFLELLAGMVSEAQVATDMVLLKLGESALQSSVPEDRRVVDLLMDASDNARNLKSFLAFLNDMVAMLSEAPADTEGLGTDIKEHDRYMGVLASFCIGYNEIVTGSGLALTCNRSYTPEPEVQLDIWKLLTKVSERYAIQTYESHVGPAISSAVTCILSMSVKIHTSQTTALAKSTKSLTDIFKVMVRDDDTNVLADIPEEAIDRSSNFAFVRTEAFVHNVMLAKLRTLVQALRVQGISVDALRAATGATSAVPVMKATVMLELVCMVRDVARLMSAFVNSLEKSGDNVDKSSLINLCPMLCCGSGQALSNLDQLLESKEVHNMEAEGWCITPSFEVARGWCAGMALLRGKALDFMLKLWSQDLTSASEGAKASCPSWGATFKDGALDEAMALSLVAGKRQAAVSAHNRLHKVLSEYGGAASAIGLAPRMQIHPSMRGSVALAMHALGVARDAATFIEGLELHASVKNKPAGPSQVQAFLSKFGPSARSGIPQAFWAWLEAFAAEAAAPLPALAGAAAGHLASRGQGVKREGEGDDAGMSEDGDAASAGAGACGQRVERRK